MIEPNHFEQRLQREVLLLLQLMSEKDVRLEQRFEAQNEALRRTEQAAEKRFEAVNEFRGQLADMINNLMPRPEVMQIVESQSMRIDTLKETVLGMQADRKGMKNGWAYLIGAIGAVATVLAIISFFLSKAWIL